MILTFCPLLKRLMGPFSHEKSWNLKNGRGHGKAMEFNFLANYFLPFESWGHSPCNRAKNYFAPKGWVFSIS